MRRTANQPTTSPLHRLVAAVPPERLREIVLDLLLNGARPSTASLSAPRIGKRRGGLRGRRGGPRPRKATATAEAKAVRNARAAAKLRQRRAAARAAAEAEEPGPAGPPNGNGGGIGNGHGRGGADEGIASPAKAAAKLLWDHAAKISPKAPWRAVANEYDLNKQSTLDAYRLHQLPPGITADAVHHFLALPIG